MENNKKCENCIHENVCSFYFGLTKETVADNLNCIFYKDKSLCVEVVRCKDCEHWKDTSFDIVTEDHWGECRRPLGDYRYCETSESDFCSYAERKLEELGV